MGESARVLGWEFGKTARDMNVLLKENGYLYGEPGAYGLTEKGEQFAQEQDHHRGTGGYSHYNRHWETRTWNDETAAALKADMAASAAAAQEKPAGHDSLAQHERPAEADDTLEYVPMAYDDEEDEEPAPTWGELAVQAAFIAAVAAAPHAKLIWDNKVKPVVWDAKLVPIAHKLRSRFAKKQEPAENQGPIEADA